MKDWIAKDEEGNVIGKWRRHTKPNLPDNLHVTEVDDVRNHKVDNWFDG